MVNRELCSFFSVIVTKQFGQSPKTKKNNLHISLSHLDHYFFYRYPFQFQHLNHMFCSRTIIANQQYYNFSQIRFVEYEPDNTQAKSSLFEEGLPQSCERAD